MLSKINDKLFQKEFVITICKNTRRLPERGSDEYQFLGSRQHGPRRAEPRVLIRCRPCSCLRGKWQQAALESGNDSLHLSLQVRPQPFNSLAKAQKIHHVCLLSSAGFFFFLTVPGVNHRGCELLKTGAFSCYLVDTDSEESTNAQVCSSIDV